MGPGRVAVLTVLVCTLALSVTVWIVSDYYQASPRFLLLKGMDWLGLDWPGIEDRLAPPALYTAMPLDGEVVQERPRILLPELRSWQGVGVAPVMAKRLRAHELAGRDLSPYQPCGKPELIAYVVCWAVTGNLQAARDAVGYMDSREPKQGWRGARPGNYWEWAVAYDLLRLSPELAPADRYPINDKLRVALKQALRQLDEESASLWHARSSLAADAWLLAISMDADTPADEDLRRRAGGHFLTALEGLALTEGWPEGYTYWINSRGLQLSLAIAAYLNGLDSSAEKKAHARAVLRRTGLWMLYMVRPDGRAESQGDEGSRIDLRHETRRVIDAIAQITGDSVFASYSLYLERRHGRDSYYSRYRSSFLLLNDPSVDPVPDVFPGTLDGLGEHLPTTELFGPGALNLLIVRSGWGAQDTFMMIKASHRLTHHGHLDAGHFTLFKGGALATSNAVYEGKVAASHRLNYGMRTISKNSLLIVDPQQTRAVTEGTLQLAPDGGQRPLLTTGSRIRNVQQWRENLGSGLHYEAATVQSYQFEVNNFVYLKVDMTAAYDVSGEITGGGTGWIVREFLYLYDDDRLFVRDRVSTKGKGFIKKWLLHTVEKPSVKDSVIVRGNDGAGIIRSRADSVAISHGNGRLYLQRLLPEKAIMRLVGGVGYEFYVPRIAGSDGSNDGESGTNYSPEPSASRWGDNGTWRLEIESPGGACEEEFLVALSPGWLLDRPGGVSLVESRAGEATQIKTPRRLIVYVDRLPSGSLEIPVSNDQIQVMLVGALGGKVVTTIAGGVHSDVELGEKDVLELEFPGPVSPGSKVLIRSQAPQTDQAVLLCRS